MDVWMDEYMDEQMDGWIDIQTNGWMDRYFSVPWKEIIDYTRWANS